MSNTLLTIWCILVTLGSLFFIGLPLSLFLNNKKNETISETSWLLAPFLGLSTIVLITQNFYYLNITIGKSFYIPWLLGACFWLIALKRYSFKNIFSSAPTSIIFIALAAYLIHGTGLLIVGAKYYLGRGWHDQINYVSGAQYLIDYTLHHPFADLNLHPFIIKSLDLVSGERIGEMFFQGFLACSAFTSAKTVFETAIITLPFFAVLAIYQLAIQLSFPKKTALFAAAIVGILPSITLIHLENFLSQALASSLLLIWPAVVTQTFARTIDWRKITTAAIILAAATTIYTEYYLIFLGIMGLYAMAQCVLNKTILRSGCTALFIVIIALALNIGFFYGIFIILHRAATTVSLGGIYPWANSLEALSRLWLGNFAAYIHGKYNFINFISLILFLSAYLGYSLKAVRQKNSLALILLALIVFPILIHSLGANKYAYQYYKLLLSISPLLVLGAILFARENLVRFFTSQIGYLCLGLFFIISGSATVYMTWQSTNIASLTALNRGGAQKFISADSKQVQEKLSDLTNKNILINWQDDFYKGNYINGWFTYFARYNNVWLTNKQVGDINLETRSASIDSIPNGFILFTYTTTIPLIVGKSVQNIWHNHTYSEFSINGTEWALLYFDEFDPMKNLSENQLVSNNENLSFNILAGENGIFTFSITNSHAKYELQNQELSKSFSFYDGTVLNIPVKKGINHIKVFAADKSKKEVSLTLHSLSFHG